MSKKEKGNKEDLERRESSRKKYDFNSLLGDDDGAYTRDLESLFKQRDFSFSFYEDDDGLTQLDRQANSDTTRVFSTGYSVIKVIPHLLLVIAMAVSFYYADLKYNVINFLSTDLKYMIVVYGSLAFIYIVMLVFFLFSILEYIGFEIYMTRYKIIAGSRFRKEKTEIPLYAINEFTKKKGILGFFMGFGVLSVLLNSRRTYSYKALANIDNLYDLIDEFKNGKFELKDRGSDAGYKSKEDKTNLNQNENESNSKNDDDSLFGDISDDYLGLGIEFSEKELRQFGLSRGKLKNRSSIKNEEEDLDRYNEDETSASSRNRDYLSSNRSSRSNRYRNEISSSSRRRNNSDDNLDLSSIDSFQSLEDDRNEDRRSNRVTDKESESRSLRRRR